MDTLNFLMLFLSSIPFSLAYVCHLTGHSCPSSLPLIQLASSMVLFPTAALMSSISFKRATILSSMLVGLSLWITPILGGDCDVLLPEEFNTLFIGALDDLAERIGTEVMGGLDEFGLGPLGTSLKSTDIFDLKTKVFGVLFGDLLFGDNSTAREEKS